ncbi:FAD-dependent oxidoreductase [Gordonia sp. HY442]|uniref:FAD-dependent oxidoreductase n=1 Tax=Gordonia zhenghanii TaxID=2911516 RepID=UPI001F3E4B24|nr:FAD-dependent oxidoreductase [Gordonia zhenghanii]MCF8603346.1 FAD-dependent oxidoreductase [Gordonia zhenghanii]
MPASIKDGDPVRVIVVGGGIAGLTAAIALRNHGHDVRVLEAREDTSAGAGISLWPNALAALDRIGVGDAVRSSGGAVTAGAMRWRDGSWIRRPDPGRLVDALGEPLVVIERATLRDVLAGMLPPGTVQFGVRVDGSAGLDADLIVGADGTRSVLARELNGSLPHTYAGYTAWRGIADAGFDPTLAGEVLGPGGQFGLVPLGPDRTYWFATARLPESTAFDDEAAYVRGLVDGWADPLPRLVAATDPDDLLRNDLYDRPTAKVLHRGRVVLVGDAAHPMRPHLGQGGCQAIEDAVTLAECIGTGDDLPRATMRYASVRRRRIRAVVRESELIGRVVNGRPAAVWEALIRSSVLVPDVVVRAHLATIASRHAFSRTLESW